MTFYTLWSVKSAFDCLLMLNTHHTSKQGLSKSRARQVLLGVSSLMYTGVCVAETLYVLQFFTIIDDMGGPLPQEAARPANIHQPASVQYYLYIVFTRINVSVELT